MRCPLHTRRRQLTPPKVRVLQTILWVVSTGRNIIFLDLFYLDLFYSLRIFNHTYCREKHPFNLKLFFWGALPAITCCGRLIQSHWAAGVIWVPGAGCCRLLNRRLTCLSLQMDTCHFQNGHFVWLSVFSWMHP